LSGLNRIAVPASVEVVCKSRLSMMQILYIVYIWVELDIAESYKTTHLKRVVWQQCTFLDEWKGCRQAAFPHANDFYLRPSNFPPNYAKLSRPPSLSRWFRMAIRSGVCSYSELVPDEELRFEQHQEQFKICRQSPRL
jgi:hypothetical protein